MANYSVLLVAALIVLSVPVLTLFVLAPLVRASRKNKVKLEPYECGVAATSPGMCRNGRALSPVSASSR